MTSLPLLPILIVEDDAPTQKLLHAVLNRHGYVTRFASNGSEAIELLGSEPYAAVVLDMMMPNVGGHSVIAFLADSGSPTPVIVCSAASPSMLTGLDAAIVKAVVRKPFDVVEFVETVARVALAADRPLSVLIIDDDPRARYTLRAFVEPAEVFEAENGEVALELLRDRTPDAIVLDLVLPGIEGEAVLRHLRETPETREIPVVVVTSRILSDHERAALLANAVAVLDKRDLSRQTMTEALATARSAVRR